jgi:hypothetical protein
MLSCSSVQPGVPIVADVCDVSRNSEAFDRKLVRVRAGVLSDLIEHTFLTSPDCPSATISLEIPTDAEGGEVFKQALVDAMPDGSISAVFTGTFEWRPDEATARVLIVSSVRDLRVVIRPPPPDLVHRSVPPKMRLWQTWPAASWLRALARARAA